MSIPSKSIQDIVHEDIILANSYVKSGELETAKDILEKLVRSGMHQPFIFQSLGEICESLDALEEAKKYLNIAIDLAKLTNDLQVVVAAKVGLSKIYLSEASNTFNKLPEIEKINELKQLIQSQEELVKNRKPVRSMLFRSNCNACKTGNGDDGRFTGSDDDCIGC